LYPTTTDVLGFQVRLTLCCIDMPVPVNAWTSGEPGAVFANESVPVTEPADCGVKVRVKPALCPADNVKGSVRPFNTNCALLLFADEIVTGSPVAARVALNCALVPTFTFPKFAVPGETVSWPGAVPLPDKATLTCLRQDLDPKEAVPLTLPLPVGLKLIVNV